MKRQILGLDINEEFVAATVVEMRGQDVEVTASGFALYQDKGGPDEVLPELLEEISWSGTTCIMGVSLAGISLRNLSIPFTESRKIDQILPLELEDQLLSPVRNHVVEYSVSGVEENQSHLLVTAVENEKVRQNLELLTNCKLNPEVITLRTLVLAEQLQRQHGKLGSFLLIDAGLHAASIAVVMQGQVVFMRRLAYPDKIFTAHPFILDKTVPGITDHDEAVACIAALCEDIRVSLGLYQMETGTEVLPEQTVLSGIMAQIPLFKEKMEEELDSQIILGDLQQLSRVELGPGPQVTWSPSLYDHALALAMQGLRKNFSVNFRKGEFGLPKLYYATKNQLAAAAVVLVSLLVGIFVYMGNDHRQLSSRYNELGSNMKVLFQETFPETKRIVDPLVQMKTNLRNVQAPSIATPIFSGDKRSLNILADVSGRIPAGLKIDVARMVIDKESVVIKGTTDAFNNVNLIQRVLRESPMYEDVDIVSASAEKDSGSIRFELKLQAVGVL